MKAFWTKCYALGVCPGLFLLSSCAPSQSTVPVFSGAARPVAPAGQRSHGHSWMQPGEANKFLLYVSNADGIVNVYRYWQHTLVGELTDFTNPQGECTDSAGDVYITDYGSDDIVEYAHGGTSPMRTINDSPYKPYGCAVDRKTGNLAVANLSQASYYSSGNLAIYKHAKGTPVYYTAKDFTNVVACAYDNYGDLLATGYYSYYYGYYQETEFGYLARNSKTLELINLPPYTSSYYWPSVQGVAWDGKYWMVTSYSTLYLYSIDIKPVEVGTVTVKGNNGPVALYFAPATKRATQAVGTLSDESTDEVNYWNYPAGGSPIDTLTHGLAEPYGIAISVGT